MKKKIGGLLAAVMVLNTVSSVAYGFTNPLQSYDLYRDTHPDISDASNNLPASPSSLTSSSTSSELSGVDVVGAEKSRNETLRESSRNVYSNPNSTPAWKMGPVYYPEPSFESIIEKYRKSDFAGCLQECTAYVRQNPNDTLGFYYLAMCYTKVSDKENAIRAYEKVIELNDNPMIVKYATNGRNCIMGNDNEKCYPDVNVPELVYPYANIVDTALTPVDPETLVNRNIAKLKEKLSPQVEEDDKQNSSNKDDKEKKLVLPFGQQDEKLDKFINAPYGNGLSPELNQEYKQLQLKKIQSTINTGKESEEKEYNNLQDIKKFDDINSDSGMIKLAYEPVSKEFESVMNDPEFVKQRQEFDELRILLGNTDSKQSVSNSDSMADLLPYMNENNVQNMSPEVIQAMMMKSLMGDINL